MIRIGDKINGRYRILSRVAQGGTSEIYEAVNLVDKSTVAIKFLLENMLNKKSNITRFEHEALIGKTLNHRNIAKVYDEGIFNERPYIVMEYVKGQTLGERLKLGHKIRYSEVCEIMIQLCDALIYIHNLNIVHRDIKPDNIYYSYDGTVKLADFGIATNLNNITPEDKTLACSVHYLAPEICQNRPITIASDIYSFGITFYELITNRLPFENKDPLEVAVSQVKDVIPPPSLYEPELPKSIEKIILKATAKNPYSRYQNALEIKNELMLILMNKKKLASRRSLFERLFGFKDK